MVSSFRGCIELACYKMIRGGPLPVINGIITPLIGVITPQLPMCQAIYSGYNPILITSRGPPCIKTTHVAVVGFVDLRMP